ncbi:hypothetical protein BDK51DRAFT_31993 [Blyttiomyces helicus]|uniref:Uncharacterized protein n=1 Tax=Blyttiomyces helicus TaxID=388810 RepID=A0A4P9W635_9FUNG|nr:hypothetical protein BDK51DRAFT_31993 [Blyttiomyces helicus]|eukprot:RKO86813.1 hypothetical protein BDK51DRAFT_31993 [Blyttiomyces helicus]
MSLVFRGITTNESFKWEDLAYEINGGSIRISRDLYNINQGLAVTPQDNDADDSRGGQDEGGPKRRKGKGKQKQPETAPTNAAASDDEMEITSIKQLRNVYNRGPLANLMEVLFPAPLP